MRNLGLATLAIAALGLSTAAVAQAPAAPAGPVHADSGLPFCTAKMQDRCIQRVDLKREGKSVAMKKPEKAM